MAAVWIGVLVGAAVALAAVEAYASITYRKDREK